MEDGNDSYGERLAQAMERAVVSRKQLAAELKISEQAVGQVIKGKTGAFTADNHVRAARFLGCDSFWLATGEVQEQDPGSGAKIVAAFADAVIGAVREQAQKLIAGGGERRYHHIPVATDRRGLVPAPTPQTRKSA